MASPSQGPKVTGLEKSPPEHEDLGLLYPVCTPPTQGLHYPRVPYPTLFAVRGGEHGETLESKTGPSRHLTYLNDHS